MICDTLLFILQNALHVRATRTFVDLKKVTRKNGEEWLITMTDTDAHIPDVYEEVRKDNSTPISYLSLVESQKSIIATSLRTRRVLMLYKVYGVSNLSVSQQV